MAKATNAKSEAKRLDQTTLNEIFIRDAMADRADLLARWWNEQTAKLDQLARDVSAIADAVQRDRSALAPYFANTLMNDLCRELNDLVGDFSAWAPRYTPSAVSPAVQAILNRFDAPKPKAKRTAV